MDTTMTVLLVLLVIYIPLWVLVWKHPRAISHGFERWGPAIKINTRFGLRFIERFGRYRRFWRAFGIFSQVVSLLLMVMMVYIMAMAVFNLPNTLSRGGIGLEYVIALPGLTPFLPLGYGVLALVVAMVCHEMAHGLQSRSNDIGVKHTGLLYGVVPLGAFVEPDQEDVRKASRRAKIDLYTAGISTNFVIAALSFLLFSTVMLGGLGSPYMDNCAVYNETDQSPAFDAGVPAGAIILDIGGEPFTYTSGYYTSDLYSWSPGDLVDVHYRTETSEHTASFLWGAYVGQTVEGSPAHGILEHKAISSIEMGGTTYRFYSAEGFSNFMGLTHPGDVVTIGYSWMEGGARMSDSATVTLGDNNGKGFLGVVTTTSGMGLITPRAMLATAANPINGASGPVEIASSLLSYLVHPLCGFAPVPDSVKWWYDAPFDGFWVICSALFWICWLNMMLGITNALPCFPFDGGYVFLGWIDAIMERMGNRDREARERRAEEITRNISSMVMFLYLMVILAAIL
ncbi:MAG: site-2 protease family protein [archaeon]|nr:site-2 protease family protein [archaeon]